MSRTARSDRLAPRANGTRIALMLLIEPFFAVHLGEMVGRVPTCNPSSPRGVMHDAYHYPGHKRNRRSPRAAGCRARSTLSRKWRMQVRHTILPHLDGLSYGSGQSTRPCRHGVQAPWRIVISRQQRAVAVRAVRSPCARAASGGGSPRRAAVCLAITPVHGRYVRGDGSARRARRLLEHYSWKTRRHVLPLRRLQAAFAKF